MTNLLAALCIPFFMSCGGQEEPIDLTKAKEAAPALMMSDGAPEPIEIKPNILIMEEPPVQQTMMRQAPIQERIVDKMATWCEGEIQYIEQEMRSEEGRSGKYKRYLNLKLKNILKECHERYRK